MTTRKIGSPPGLFLGTAIFWFSVCILLASPFLPGPWNVFLALLVIEPIIYGTHEALHAEAHKQKSSSIRWPSITAAVGMCLQLQNIEIMRHAHLFHHRMGRYGDGWAPDITPDRPTPFQRIHYYFALVLLPAITWQIACIIRPFLPLKKQPYLRNIGYSERVTLRFLASWIGTVLFAAYFIQIAGVLSFSLFWLGLCFLWSVQQNIAHYGLKGVDPATDRVCAHTYYLQRPFSWITYGSTSHFLHHADVTLPASSLYEVGQLRKQESHYNITIVPKYGIIRYMVDIARQFKGPVPVHDLTLDWVESISPRQGVHIQKDFEYRKGRVYSREA